MKIIRRIQLINRSVQKSQSSAYYKFDFLPAIQKSDDRQQLAIVFINVITDSLYLTNNNDSIVQFLR